MSKSTQNKNGRFNEELCAPSRKQGLRYRYETARGNRKSNSDSPIRADKGYFWMKPEPRGELNVKQTTAKIRSCTKKAMRADSVRRANSPADFGIKEACSTNIPERNLSSKQRKALARERKCYV